MKTLIIIISAFAFLTGINAADTLDTRITDATVYLSGAQVFRKTKTFTIRKGINKVVIRNVSPYLNRNSIQASAKGNFLIVDVEHSVHHILPPKVKPQQLPLSIRKEIKHLEDSLAVLNLKSNKLNNKLQFLRNEKDMIINNPLMKGGGKSDSLPVLKDAVKYYRIKLYEIEDQIYKQSLIRIRYDKDLSRMNTRLNELRNYKSHIVTPDPRPRDEHNIVLTTYSEVQTKGTVLVNYMVPNAGWVPAYDLRASEVNKPMQITYKAYVYQNSGEDWDNVNLTLSTYNQNCFMVKPQLGIWRISYYVPVSSGRQMQLRSSNFIDKKMAPSTISDRDFAAAEMVEEEFIPIQEISEVSQSMANVEFKIKLPYSIPANGNQKLLVVNHHTIDAKYNHTIVPKADQYAHLIAKVGGWEELNFMRGKANIYFRNTYVGQTQIDPMNLSDTLEFALGRDQRIVSTRKKIDEEVKNTVLRNRVKKTYTFEIVLRNNSQSKVDLNVQDQIPVSNDESIKVELVESDDAVFEENTGFLKWKLPLNPGEKRKLIFKYTVEHDKGKKVS